MSPEEAKKANDSFSEEIATDTKLISAAIGGWQGILDASLPTSVFLVAFIASDHNLKLAIFAALFAGGTLAIVRLVQRRSLQQVTSGLFGLGISAFIASRTGRSETFFLQPIIMNAVYLVACVVSLVVKKPLVGYIVEGFKGKDANWRNTHTNAHKYTAATWIWVGVFALRLIITVPLYLAGNTTWLATAKLILGTPLYALAIYITYLVIKSPQRIEESE